ncbi:MAG: hypothetical protein QOE76_709 [Frankiales bacterium]|jgi:hypothetical protein|nr:hypothetical protein [Frankiales bacterium]
MPDLRAVLAGLALVGCAAGPAGAAAVSTGAAPAAPQPVPVVLDGVHAVLRWRNPDPTVTRVVVRRLDGAVAPGSPVDGAAVFDGSPDPAALQLVTDTVVVGATYSYGFWAYDAAGAVSAEATHSIRATATPLLTAPGVVSDVSTTGRFALSWGNPANPAGNPYTVKYAGSAGAPWVIWLLDTSDTHAVFGAGASPFVPVPGATYRFEVLSQDPYGNDTRHALGTVVEPLDTRAATLSRGWRTLPSTRRWGGTVAVATRAGATATFRVTGSQVTVIADRCPGCGKAVVRVDGRIRAVVDTHAPALSVRRQVGTVAHLSPGRHVVAIQVVGTTGHPGLQLDGLAVLD